MVDRKEKQVRYERSPATVASVGRTLLIVSSRELILLQSKIGHVRAARRAETAVDSAASGDKGPSLTVGSARSFGLNDASQGIPEGQTAYHRVLYTHDSGYTGTSCRIVTSDEGLTYALGGPVIMLPEVPALTGEGFSGPKPFRGVPTAFQRKGAKQTGRKTQPGTVPDKVMRWEPAVEEAIRGMSAPISVEEVLAVIWAESAGDPDAKSSAGAVGLMQLMPGTAKGKGYEISDRTDPVKNIKMGISYLTTECRNVAITRAGEVPQLTASGVPNHAWRMMLGAYNWGHGRMAKNQNMHTWPLETKNYVGVVAEYYAMIKENKRNGKP